MRLEPVILDEVEERCSNTVTRNPDSAARANSTQSTKYNFQHYSDFTADLLCSHQSSHSSYRSCIKNDLKRWLNANPGL